MRPASSADTPMFLVWFVDMNDKSKDITVTSHNPPQSCFSYQYQIAHLLSPKQRKHNLWLKIKHSYLFLSYYGVPREKMLFCCLAGVFCSRFGGMSLFIVNFWCFIWYALLSPTRTEVFIFVSRTACEVPISGSHRAENVFHRQLCQAANAVIIADCRLARLYHQNQYVIRHIMQNP